MKSSARPKRRKRVQDMLKWKTEECEYHLDIDITWIDRQKYCSKCGKAITTIEDENKIKRTHDEGC